MVVLLFFVFFVVFPAEGSLVSLQRLFGRPGRPILSNSSEYLALVERADFAIYDHHDRYELGITFERQINCSLRDRFPRSDLTYSSSFFYGDLSIQLLTEIGHHILDSFRSALGISALARLPLRG